MKILIMSDTHRRDRNMETVLQSEQADRVIHLGDIEGSQEKLRQMVSCPVDIVEGNNDFMWDLPEELEITLGGRKVLLTHGHLWCVSLDIRVLAREAQNRGCQIAMYGHTHRPRIDEVYGVTMVNPGSLSYPRQQGRRPSYIMMEIDPEDRIRYEIRYL